MVEIGGKNWGEVCHCGVEWGVQKIHWRDKSSFRNGRWKYSKDYV